MWVNTYGLCKCVCVSVSVFTHSKVSRGAVTLSRSTPLPPHVTPRDRDLFPPTGDYSGAASPSVFRLLSGRRGYRCYAQSTQSLWAVPLYNTHIQVEVPIIYVLLSTFKHFHRTEWCVLRHLLTVITINKQCLYSGLTSCSVYV